MEKHIILAAKDLNQFLKAFYNIFPQIDDTDVIKAVQILIAFKKEFIKKNLKNNELNKIIYKQIQNAVPEKIIYIITPKYSFTAEQEKILDNIYIKNFHFDNLVYDYKILKLIDSIILEEKKKDLTFIKETYNFDEIIKNEHDIILQFLEENAKLIMNDKLDILHELIKDNNIKDINQLIQFLLKKQSFIKKCIDEIVGIIMPKKICAKYEYNIKDAMLFAKYLPSQIDIIPIIIKVISNMNTDILFSLFVGDPWDFIDFDDSTKEPKNIVYSTRSPYEYSANRTSPLIVIDNEVLWDKNEIFPHHEDLIKYYKKIHNIDDDDDITIAYNQGYESYKNVGVGSCFDTVVLLELIQGDINIIKSALINEGFQKVYVNNRTNWASKEYRRIAQYLLKQRLDSKI